MTMREKFNAGHGVRLTGGQWIYQGNVYDVPPKGAVFRKAKPSSTANPSTKSPVNFTPSALRRLLATGTIPSPKVTA
jgi:hypothetical protein